ncbi:MAG: DUF4102 domain-containing protein [Alphaproteobacteria bacterium]|nr:MAG: DUF4102 domain-containing protein [Alphaproteobacteria bacterium]
MMSERKRNVKLTKRFVDSLKAQTKEQRFWDADVKGFGLRIWPSGKKVFIVRYRLPHQGSKHPPTTYTIGEYGVKTVEEARQDAKDIVSQAGKGLDAAQSRKKLKAEWTIKELGEEYFEKYVKIYNKPSVQKQIRRALDRKIYPRFGRRLVGHVTRRDVKEFIADMVATPTEANNTFAYFRKMFSYAVDAEIRPDNPCFRVKKHKTEHRKRIFEEVETEKILQALSKAEKEKRFYDSSTALIRFLFSTGFRIGEAVNLKWGEVYSDTMQVIMEDTKTGRSHRPISEHARQILLEQKGDNAEQDEDFVFVVPGTKKALSYSYLRIVWNYVRAETKIKKINIHDIRRTFLTIAGTISGNAFAVRDIGGHKDIATTSGYVQQNLKARQELMNNTAKAMLAKTA